METTYRVQIESFNGTEIQKRANKANARNLRFAGAVIRRRARRSIRKRKKPSAPGKPPSSHKGTLKNLITYDVDKNKVSVVVGAEKDTKPGRVPNVLEYGGLNHGVKNSRRRDLKVGMSGVIRIGKKKKNAKPVSNFENKRKWVTFAILKTQRQVIRAEENEEKLWGKKEYLAQIEPRPYMGPAFAESLPQIPATWRDSL